MAIQQSGGLGFELHENPPVECGSLARLLISHAASVIEAA
jgi:hypothetical protein